MYTQCSAKLIENVQRKKCDLALVIVFKIDVTITANPMPCDTFDQRNFDHGMRVRFATVMADKIMADGNVKMADFHRAHDNIEKLRFT